jgi:dihydrofolate reductase
MAFVTVVNHITLDGVMQAPMGADEDRAGGFAHGGWALPFQDEVMGREMGAGIGETGTLLLGRRTYDHMAAAWPQAPDDNPYKRVMMEFRKLVASRTLSGPLEWRNAELLEGDAGDALAAIEGNVTALGSGALVQSLLGRGLVDAWVLNIHPLVLGAGKRLFPDGGAPARFRLDAVTPTTTGVLIARYARA